MIELAIENKGFLFIAYFIVLIVLILSIKRKNSKDVFLSKYDSQVLKGVSAILIVLHHLSQRIGINIITLPYIEIGKYSVALFLFLAGFGVMSSYLSNKNYLNGFLKKRILTIYVPFVISNIIFIVVDLIKGQDFEAIDIIKYALGIKLIDGVMWFIYSIVIFYLIFYISFRFTTIKKGTIIFSIGAFIYLILGIVLNLGTTITNIAFSFAGGIFVAAYKENFIRFLNKKYVFKIIGIIAILGITRIISIISSNIFIREFILNISTLSYAILLVSLSKRFKLTGNIIALLSGISFEIYLLHNKLITVIPNINGSIIIGIMYFITLVILSYIFRRINEFINNKLVIKNNIKGTTPRTKGSRHININLSRFNGYDANATNVVFPLILPIVTSASLG